MISNKSPKRVGIDSDDVEELEELDSNCDLVDKINDDLIVINGSPNTIPNPNPKQLEIKDSKDFEIMNNGHSRIKSEVSIRSVSLPLNLVSTFDNDSSIHNPNFNSNPNPNPNVHEFASSIPIPETTSNIPILDFISSFPIYDNTSSIPTPDNTISIPILDGNSKPVLDTNNRLGLGLGLGLLLLCI
jgi:hypothetical protein